MIRIPRALDRLSGIPAAPGGALVAASLVAVYLACACAEQAGALYGMHKSAGYRREELLSLNDTLAIMRINAQAIALTSLAPESGDWGIHREGQHTQVVTKGNATRVVPTPTALRLSEEIPGAAKANLLFRDGAPAMVIQEATGVCRRLLSRGGLSKFATASLDYKISETGQWKRYGSDFSCSWLGPEGSDVILFRAARPDASDLSMAIGEPAKGTADR